jgi:hypothetical protein
MDFLWGFSDAGFPINDSDHVSQCQAGKSAAVRHAIVLFIGCILGRCLVQNMSAYIVAGTIYKWHTWNPSYSCLSSILSEILHVLWWIW